MLHGQDGMLNSVRILLLINQCFVHISQLNKHCIHQRYAWLCAWIWVELFLFLRFLKIIPRNWYAGTQIKVTGWFSTGPCCNALTHPSQACDVSDTTVNVHTPHNSIKTLSFPRFQIDLAIAHCYNSWKLNTSSLQNAWQAGLGAFSGSKLNMLLPFTEQNFTSQRQSAISFSDEHQEQLPPEKINKLVLDFHRIGPYLLGRRSPAADPLSSLTHEPAL